MVDSRIERGIRWLIIIEMELFDLLLEVANPSCELITIVGQFVDGLLDLVTRVLSVLASFSEPVSATVARRRRRASQPKTDRFGLSERTETAFRRLWEAEPTSLV